MASVVVYFDGIQLSNQNGKAGERHLDVMSRNLISLARRMKDKAGGEIVAVLIGQREDGIYLREALAAGCSRAVLAQPLQAGWDAYLAAALAVWAGGEALLMGGRAMDGGTSYLDGQVSELLHIPHVSGVSDILGVSGRQLTVAGSGNGWNHGNGGNDLQAEIAVEMPCLLTVGEKEQEALPISVEGILQAFEKEIQFVARDEGEQLACSFLGRGSLDGLCSLQVLEEIAAETSRACEMINCIPITDGTENEGQNTIKCILSTNGAETAGQESGGKTGIGNVTYKEAVKILMEKWKERG